jgi:hypothetical protein
MFRSLFEDHLQGSSFALSAPTMLQLHASSFVCIGMWSYALYLYVYLVYLLPVCCLVVQSTGLSVLWVAYATHSTLKPVPTLPR